MAQRLVLAAVGLTVLLVLAGVRVDEDGVRTSPGDPGQVGDGITWQYGTTGVGGTGANQLQDPGAAHMLENGNVLITDSGNCRVIEVDPSGEIVWQYGTTGVVGWDFNELGRPAWDAQRLPSGNTLITDCENCRIIEVTPEKQIVWQYGTTRVPNVLFFPRDAEMLGNGNVLISDTDHWRIIEVDHGKNIVWQHGGMFLPTDADRLANGNTLISEPDRYWVIEVTPSNEVVWRYGTGVCGYGLGEIGLIWDADRLANGNTLITDTTFHRVIEVSPEGEIVWQYGVNGTSGTDEGYLYHPWDAERLPDGSTLIAEKGNHRVIRVGTELNIQGRVTYLDDSNNILTNKPIGRCRIGIADQFNPGVILAETYSDLGTGEYNLNLQGIHHPFNAVISIYCTSPGIVEVLDASSNELIVFQRYYSDLVPGQYQFDIQFNGNQERKIWQTYNLSVQSYLLLKTNVMDNHMDLDNDNLMWDSWDQKEIPIRYHINECGTSHFNELLYLIEIYEYHEDETQTPTSIEFTVPHEYGHAVMCQLYRNDFPLYPVVEHDLVTEQSMTGAFCEGWADFFAYVIFNEYQSQVELGWLYGRESERYYNKYGEDCEDFDGELVEGAIAGILWDIIDDDSYYSTYINNDDDLDSSFVAIWEVLRERMPMNIIDFWSEWYAIADIEFNTYLELEKIYIQNGVMVAAIADLISDIESCRSILLIGALIFPNWFNSLNGLDRGFSMIQTEFGLIMNSQNGIQKEHVLKSLKFSGHQIDRIYQMINKVNSKMIPNEYRLLILQAFEWYECHLMHVTDCCEEEM